MTYQPQYTLETPLEENISFAEEFPEFLIQITKVYRDIALKVNNKERAFYPSNLEIMNDQQFFTTGNPQSYRRVFRKVFSFGAIAAGATLNIAHGITGITVFTRIYGTTITAVPDDRPLPYVDAIAVTNQTSVLRNGINIVIVNGATAPNITSGICVVEFLKQ
jgi:hypothetical protein